MKPNSLEKKMEELGKDAEKILLSEDFQINKENNKKQIHTTDKEQKISLSEFISQYNILENKAKYIIKELGVGNIHDHIPLYNSINILLKYEIIDRTTSLQINEIRRLRNYLVHGITSSHEGDISFSIYTILTEINNKLDEKLNEIRASKTTSQDINK